MSSLRSATGAACVAVVASLACSESAGTPTAEKPQEDQSALAADAFVWGFPLVVTRRTLQTFAGLIGENSLFGQTQLSDASTRLVVAPNQDTLYSVAVVDLRTEPMVLTVPDVHDRYWTYQFLDGWTNSFHYLGTRATGGNGGTFVITPPGYAGSIPSGMTEIAAPTPTLFLLGRFLVRDSADATNVTALVRRLAPLHVVTGEPDSGVPPPLGKPQGTPQTVGADGASFFDELGDALGLNPPATDFDKSELARFAPLGIAPNAHPAADAKDQSVRAALEAGVTTGMKQIDDALDSPTHAKNGWTTFGDIGLYDTDVLLRAMIAKFAWGANVPAEAVYPVSHADRDGNAYSGQKDYVLHFDAGNLPPVDADHGFWSLTLYGMDGFFVENSIKRYAIGDRTQGLTFNADGSLDLFIQNAEPAALGNWLPCPTDPFTLVLRLYLPNQSVLDGTYGYPPVKAQ